MGAEPSHVRPLARRACTCDQCLRLSRRSRTTDLKTGTAAGRKAETGESESDTPSTCESTTTGLLWSRSSWPTAVGEERGAEVGGVVVVVCPLGGGVGEGRKGEEWRTCLLMHSSGNPHEALPVSRPSECLVILGSERSRSRGTSLLRARSPDTPPPPAHRL